MIDVPTRVKDALRDGRRLKEYRFVVLKSDGTADFTIDNDYLVKESVKIDERMVTGSELKFGLCEGSSLEFQYFNKPNINGKQIQAFIDVQYKDADGTLKWQTIPMGWFTVDQCPMQFSTGIYKVTAYNKLKSEYLDTKISDTAVSTLSAYGSTNYIVNILGVMLNEYAIIPAYTYQIIPVHYYSTLDTKFATNAQYNDICGTSPMGAYPDNDMTIVYPFYVDVFECTVSYTEYDLARTYITEYMKSWAEVLIDYIGLALEDSGLDISFNDFISPMMFPYIDAETAGTAHLFSHPYLKSLGKADGSYADIENLVIGGNITIGLPIAIVRDGSPSGYAVKDVLKLAGPNYTYTYNDPVTFLPATKTQITPKVNGADVIIEFNTFDSDVYFEVREILDDTSDKIDYMTVDIEDFNNASIRDIQSAVFEIDCQYGKLDRTTDLFSGIELNQSFLYPADNLYPSDTLYPSGIAESSFKSQYSKLWTDMVGEQSFRNLIITYKGTIVDPDTQQTSEGDKIITKVVNANGTTDYIMDNNWLFKNLLWADQDVEDYADAMVLKMQSIKWFPFEMWGAGLPYIESGDMIEISDREGNTYTTYILQRQLEGIQNLQDTYINGELDIF